MLTSLTPTRGHRSVGATYAGPREQMLVARTPPRPQPQREWDDRFNLSSCLDHSPIINGIKASRTKRWTHEDDWNESKRIKKRRERQRRARERRMIKPSWSGDMNELSVTRPTAASKSALVQQRQKHTCGPPSVFSNVTHDGQTTEYNRAGYVGMHPTFTQHRPTSTMAGMHALQKEIELALRTQPKKMLRLFEDTEFESEELRFLTGTEDMSPNSLNVDEFQRFVNKISLHPDPVLITRIFHAIDTEREGSITFEAIARYFHTMLWQAPKQPRRHRGFPGSHHDRWAKREHAAWR
eukprot:g441.t1